MSFSKTSPRFILLGASLDTGNMGVSALLVSTVKCIRHAHPDAIIDLLEGAVWSSGDELPLVDGQVVPLGKIGVRRNKTLWRRNHLVRLLCTAMLLRLVPIRTWRYKLLARNPYLGPIASADCVADITGGDSFSDIYGIRRLILGTLQKLLVLAVGADLVFLPQTYGPFKGRLARALARFVLCRAAAIYSRDKPSLDVLSDLLPRERMRATPQFAPDMAFVLDPIAPPEVYTTPAGLPSCEDVTLIGLNVSGLLYNGGYTQDNMFGLRADYRLSIVDVASALLRLERTVVLLVPHVFKPQGHLESDPDACRAIYGALEAKFSRRVYLLEGEYDQNGIKYVIGKCDFFVGSRMHACIAAVSQGIPAAALAYSRKFHGVFDSIGIAHLVVDLCTCDGDSVTRAVLEAFHRRREEAEHLRYAIPTIQKTVLNTLGTCSTMQINAPKTLNKGGSPFDG